MRADIIVMASLSSTFVTASSRFAQRIRVSAKEQQLVLDSREFAPGTYSVLLVNNGATLQTKNLIVRQ